MRRSALVRPSILTARFAPAGLAIAGLGARGRHRGGGGRRPRPGRRVLGRHRLARRLDLPGRRGADLPRDQRARRLRHPRRAGAARRRAWRPSAATPRCRSSSRWPPAAAVAGDVVSFLLGRRLGRPFLELHGARVRSAPRSSPASTASSRATAARPSSSGASPGSSAPPCRSSPAARAWPCAACSRSASSARSSGPRSSSCIGYAFSESVTSAGDTATRVALVAVLLVTVAFFIRSRAGRRSREQGSRCPS